MSKVVFEPKPRYVVQLGAFVESITGEARVTHWVFRFAFADLAAAEAHALYEAETEQFVRVVDRGDS